MSIIIEYNASVMVPAGWRSVTIRARAELNKTGKMAEVMEVIEIDGEEPVGYASRTGANRQKYNAAGIAAREVGARKRISSCSVLDETVI